MAKKKKKVSSKKTLRLTDVWPQERDFMERPDRYRYVRKIIKQTGCVFCQAADQEPSFDSLILVKDETTLVMLNKYPYNTGHLLILPRRHVGDLTELSALENHALADWIQRSVAILKAVYQCEGLNMGMNHGAVAGAGIPGHLHWHVIPRWSGDTNFFPLIAETKALPETQEQTYNKLVRKFREAEK